MSDYICHDCGMDTTPCTSRRGCRHKERWEHYMVHNHLWEQAGITEGFLCIGCLEHRLSRTLEIEDFTTAPINWPDPWMTPRLLSRVTGQVVTRPASS